MQWAIYPFLIFAGVLNAVQTGMNAQLNKSLGKPILAAPIVYIVGLLTMLLVWPFLGGKLGGYAKLAQTPWWAYLGGVGGAVFIYAMLATAQKVGAGVFTGLTVTATLITSVALDHFGALGVDKHPANPMRLVALAMMLAGIGLLARF